MGRALDTAVEEIARTVERRPKCAFHRLLCERVTRMWADPAKRQALIELGLVKPGG